MGSISSYDKAEVLVQALPYIKKYYKKTIVIKYGGNAMINSDLTDAVMSDLVLLALVGINVVLVHGGGPDINSMLNRLNIESKFVGGLRYTDEQTMEVVQMVLAGKTNKNLVKLLTAHGGKAVGLSGIDGGLIKAKRIEELGYVGEIQEVNTTVITDLVNDGYIPVISTVGYDDEGNSYNINADTAAANIAAELNAEKLILMTDIRGLLRDKDDPDTLIPMVALSEVPLLKKQGVISGGMIPKIDCCVDSVRRGVNDAVIIDGRNPHSILVEMLSDEGIGTMFKQI